MGWYLPSMPPTQPLYPRPVSSMTACWPAPPNCRWTETWLSRTGTAFFEHFWELKEIQSELHELTSFPIMVLSLKRSLWEDLSALGKNMLGGTSSSQPSPAGISIHWTCVFNFSLSSWTFYKTHSDLLFWLPTNQSKELNKQRQKSTSVSAASDNPGSFYSSRTFIKQQIFKLIKTNQRFKR